MDGEEVLGKIRGFELTSWNFIGHDPKQFRHYGPMAQDFYAAFGHDGLGQIGTETTINSGDIAGILMIAVQALEKRTAELKQKEAQIAVLESKVADLEAKEAHFETVAARLEALELRITPIQINSREKPRRQDGQRDALIWFRDSVKARKDAVKVLHTGRSPPCSTFPSSSVDQYQQEGSDK